MSIKDIDLDIENYSIREIRSLFKLDDEYSSDDIQRNVDKLFFTINKSEDLSMAEKKKMCHFFNALKVILIRHLNNNEGMYNNYGNIEGIEPENKVIDINNSHQYSDSREKSDGTGLINNPENYTTLNHSKSVHDIFRHKETERNNLENKNDLTEIHALKYIKDNLNPIKQQIITKCITFDTRFRENYYATKSTDFKCKIPDRLTNVISMQLAAFEFPTSYFIINESLDNNFFSYQIIDSGNVAEIKTLSVPSGNYSHTELIAQINDAIINNGDNIVLEVDITSLGSGTGKTIIRNQNTNIINIYFDRDRQGNNDDNNTFDTYTSVFNSSILNKNILARISLKTPAFHILNETGMQLVTEPRKYLGPVNISSFNVQILDEFGRVLNINNMDYSFCLNFECLYK